MNKTKYIGLIMAAVMALVSVNAFAYKPSQDAPKSVKDAATVNVAKPAKQSSGNKNKRNSAKATQPKAESANAGSATASAKPSNTTSPVAATPSLPLSESRNGRNNPGVISASNGIVYDADKKEIRYAGKTYKFVNIPAGIFRMGSVGVPGTYEDDEDEFPAHKVSLSGYSIGITEVPQWLWIAVMKANPSNEVGEYLPVESVSWDDCIAFTRELSRLTGHEFTLPTEAQWEYAARGGEDCLINPYSGGRNINKLGYYSGNSDGSTHKVASLNPNKIGLYDMSGNVWEWCLDYYSEKYPAGLQVDPISKQESEYRITRGGSYAFGAEKCRITQRFGTTQSAKAPDLGLRLVTD